ncbi:recombinase family protein [Microbacterium sp.]|uniref:recombinase family protein n=1 Tax=Microbacterium sp. TaxID=51671 RepID=UPI0025DE6F89|nr:recombinase family protein [Microbacterium sp.]
MTRLVGYSRELSPGAGVASDVAQLTGAGAVRVFTDEGSTEGRARPGLQECVDFLEPGDTLLVMTAATLAATVPQFLATVNCLTGRGVAFLSLSESALCAGVGSAVDPAEVFAALDALRRRLVSLQTRAGMASAAGEGRRPGRPTVMTPERVAMAVELRNLGRPVTHIARVLGVSANAVQRALGATSNPPRPHVGQTSAS